MGKVREEEIRHGRGEGEVGGAVSATKEKVTDKEPAECGNSMMVLEPKKVQDKDLCHGEIERIQGVGGRGRRKEDKKL